MAILPVMHTKTFLIRERPVKCREFDYSSVLIPFINRSRIYLRGMNRITKELLTNDNLLESQIRLQLSRIYGHSSAQ